MFTKLREILLTQYMGSILVALLAVQALIEIITTAVRTGFWWFNQPHRESVLGGSRGSSFPWDNIVFAAVTVALYLVTAYALARWLFPIASATAQPDSNNDPAADQPEQS